LVSDPVRTVSLSATKATVVLAVPSRYRSPGADVLEGREYCVASVYLPDESTLGKTL